MRLIAAAIALTLVISVKTREEVGASWRVPRPRVRARERRTVRSPRMAWGPASTCCEGAHSVRRLESGSSQTSR